MTPPRSILDRSFKYTPSVETDLRATFKRIRRERQQAEEARKATYQPPVRSVEKA
jgi:hypothetical protein